MTDKLNVDQMIKKLLSVRGKKNLTVKLKEGEITQLLMKVKKIFEE